MIKKFIIRTLLVGIIFSGILILVLLASSQYVESKGFKNSQTESNTLILSSDQEYDLMFMGISHARNFSRYGNHEVVENILNKKIINIGQGGGTCGVNEQLFYLEYFYSKGNKVDTVFFILTPPMLTSEKLPVSSNTFDSELFDLNFFLKYLSFGSENKYERTVQYMQSKLKSKWIHLKPDLTIGKKDSLKGVNMEAIRSGMELAHGKNINVERFNASCAGVEKIIETVKMNDSEIVMIIPPALFGKWPEHNLVIDFAKKMKKEQNVMFYDFSESVLQPKYYYDHHHLNTKGVEYFANVFLKPLF